MAESYPERIRLAEQQLTAARHARDLRYPGSPEWEDAQVKVREWEQALSDLRRAQAG